MIMMLMMMMMKMIVNSGRSTVGTYPENRHRSINLLVLIFHSDLGSSFLLFFYPHQLTWLDQSAKHLVQLSTTHLCFCVVATISNT